jgi:hypothetical protein
LRFKGAGAVELCDEVSAIFYHAMNAMTAMGDERLAVLEPREKVDAARVLTEIEDAINGAASIGAFEKIEAAHLTRRCLWAGQSADGMRHGEDAFPYDKAIDCRVPLAEEIVTDHVRIRMAAMRSGTVQIGPMQGVADATKARLWDDVLKFYRHKMRRGLERQMRLFWTCVEEIGYGVARVDWCGMRRLLPLSVTVEELAGSVAAGLLEAARAQTGMAEGEEMPAEWQEEAAAEAMRVVEEALMDEDAGAFEGLMMSFDPTCPRDEARRVRSDLRRRGGAAVYYAPRDAGGEVRVTARIPWVDCGHSLDLGPDGRCSWWFEADWLTEVDLRAAAEAGGWDGRWLKAVLEQPNMGMADLMQGLDAPGWLLNGVGVGLRFDTGVNQRARMFQVLRVFRLAVNKAGLPACYETVVHPHVPDLTGFHAVCKVPVLPWVAEAREPAGLMVQSRGVPELVLTDQLALKKLKDGATASAELAAFPPYERIPGDDQKMAPGAQLAAARRTGRSGTESRFVPVPGVDQGALEMMRMTRADVDRLFARGPNVSPDERRIFLEELGSSAVATVEEVMMLAWLHVQGYVDELRASRIAGRPVSVEATAEDLQGTADVMVEFSPLALNQKMALELADYGAKIAGLDRTGRIDFGKFVEVVTRVFDPMLSEQVIRPGDEAAAEIERDEQGVLSAIASGQWVTGHTDAPQVRWEVVQRWLANPEARGKLQASGGMQAALAEHVKGLQQEMVQRGANVFTGQTGQKPEAPWEEGMDLMGQLAGAMAG